MRTSGNEKIILEPYKKSQACQNTKNTKTFKYMKPSEVKFEKQNKVAWITLNRPEKRNALTQTMMKEWRNLLSEIGQDENCRVIVVTGEGKAFSAGVDLSVFQEIKIESGYEMYDDGIKIMRLLETLPQVTIAMLNSAQTIAAIKELYRYGSLHTLKEGLDYERDFKTAFTDKTENLKNFKKEL